MGGDAVLRLLRDLFANEFFKGFQGRNRKLGAGKTNGGKRRLGEVSEGNVVKANERNVAWYVQPRVADRPERAYSGEVVGSDYSRRRLRQAQQVAHGKNATFHT